MPGTFFLDEQAFVKQIPKTFPLGIPAMDRQTEFHRSLGSPAHGNSCQGIGGRKVKRQTAAEPACHPDEVAGRIHALFHPVVGHFIASDHQGRKQGIVKITVFLSGNRDRGRQGIHVSHGKPVQIYQESGSSHSSGYAQIHPGPSGFRPAGIQHGHKHRIHIPHAPVLHFHPDGEGRVCQIGRHKTGIGAEQVHADIVFLPGFHGYFIQIQGHVGDPGHECETVITGSFADKSLLRIHEHASRIFVPERKQGVPRSQIRSAQSVQHIEILVKVHAHELQTGHVAESKTAALAFFKPHAAGKHRVHAGVGKQAVGRVEIPGTGIESPVVPAFLRGKLGMERHGGRNIMDYRAFRRVVFRPVFRQSTFRKVHDSPCLDSVTGSGG